MKKTIGLLSSLLFVGAGCFSSGSVDVQVEPNAVPETEQSGTNAGTEVNVKVGTGTEAEVTVEAEVNVSLEAGNFFFNPDTITANAGQTVNVTINSVNGYHTLVIDKIGLKETVKAGGTISFTAPTTPGSYPFYCDVGSHRSAGMEGTLVVK